MQNVDIPNRGAGELVVGAIAQIGADDGVELIVVESVSGGESAGGASNAVGVVDLEGDAGQGSQVVLVGLNVHLRHSPSVSRADEGQGEE